MATDENTRYWQRKANKLRGQWEIDGRVAVNDAIVTLEETANEPGLDKMSIQAIKSVVDRLKRNLDSIDAICGE